VEANSTTKFCGVLLILTDDEAPGVRRVFTPHPGNEIVAVTKGTEFSFILLCEWQRAPHYESLRCHGRFEVIAGPFHHIFKVISFEEVTEPKVEVISEFMATEGDFDEVIKGTKRIRPNSA
jgi:hypothetical protein